MKYFYLLVFVIFFGNQLLAQSDESLKPIYVEAESGVAGSGFSTGQDGDISYLAPNTTNTLMTGPGDTSKIVTFSVTFPDSGYYRLYARIQVGSGGYNDDSFFAGKGFGEKNPTTSSNWVLLNGLAASGYTSASDFVDTEGSAGTQVWKWINVTRYFGSVEKQTFYVHPDSLTKVFQMGSREDGLFFDKLAFGKANLYYTVKALDNGLAGSTTNTMPSNFYQGPALAKGNPKFLGNLMGNDNIFVNYWNQITPENEGKWASVGNSTDSTKWNWTNLDRIYNYAKQNNILFKFHTLIWGAQQPSWISGLDQASQLKYIETWMYKVGQRYPDIDLIDVVNEPLLNHNPPDGTNGRANYKNALGGDGTTGWDWVIKAFELARKYLPAKTKLLLNEYGIINDNNATSTYLTIINLLKNRGLIDGIGVQGHRFEFEYATNATLKYNLDRLAATGLPIYISEMDLGNYSDSGTPNDDTQLQLYQRVFPVVWDHPGVKGITLWGYIEGAMWQKTCHLVLKDGTWRPAMTWMADYVKKSTDANFTVSASEPALDNFPNPFTNTTTIRFSIPSSSGVIMKVYDMVGKEVATLVDENMSEGIHSITWDAKSQSGARLDDGIYFIKLIAGNSLVSKKMMLIK